MLCACRGASRRLPTIRCSILTLLIPLQAFAQVTGPDPADGAAARASLRLTFRFDRDRVELVRVEPLNKVAPGEVLPVPIPGLNSGAWLVLVDANDEPLFHRLLDDPFGLRAEHHTEHGPSIHVRPAASGTFQAVLPAMLGARRVVLFSSPPDPRRMSEPARELARFRLDNPSN